MGQPQTGGCRAGVLAVCHLPLDDRYSFGVTRSLILQGKPMAGTHLSIRIDLSNGNRIGPGKVALLEAIRAQGSISGAARSLGMSYRRAWLLVEEINKALAKPAVIAEMGGRSGGGASVTPVGEKIVDLYRSIERRTRKASHSEFRAMAKLVRAGK
jgi:molybdate transport system regulatory protein